MKLWDFIYIYIYIYAFSRRFYPKRLTVHSAYTCFITMCVPWESNPQPFALLTQCSTTEPQEHHLWNLRHINSLTIIPVVPCPDPLPLPQQRWGGRSGPKRTPAWGPGGQRPAGGVSHLHTRVPEGVWLPANHTAERAASWGCCHSPVGNSHSLHIRVHIHTTLTSVVTNEYSCLSARIFTLLLYSHFSSQSTKRSGIQATLNLKSQSFRSCKQSIQFNLHDLYRTDLEPDYICGSPLGDDALTEAAVHTSEARVWHPTRSCCSPCFPLLNRWARVDHCDVEVHWCHRVPFTLSGPEQEMRGGASLTRPFYQGQ